ncbi:MAG: multicopper oxidase domain-containing protein [Candidatus Nitrosocaldaceae archaeon]
MKNVYRLLSLVAVVAISSSLLTATFMTSPLNTSSTDLYKNNISEQSFEGIGIKPLDVEMAHKIREMGGLLLQVSNANALTEEEALKMSKDGRKIVEFTVIGQTVNLPIMGGTPDAPKMYQAMTFNQQVPGPTLRVKQGDIVKFTLAVPEGEMFPHGRSIHAAQGSVVPGILAVNPGDSRTTYFIAEVPGVFKYHCTGVNVADMDRHVLSGMYGLIIVDPVDGYKPLLVRSTATEDGEIKQEFTRYSADAYELQFNFNNLYIDANGNYDINAMLMEKPTQSVINGMALGYTPNNDLDALINGDANKDILPGFQPWQAFTNQYKGQLIYVPTNEHIRIFAENHGTQTIFVHFIGEIFDRITMGNRIQAEGVESWGIPGSTGAIIDIVFENPGVYVWANHDYSNAMTGHVAIFVAGNFFKEALRDDLGDAVDGINYYAEALGQPSDAIPPPALNTKLWPKFNLHGLYTDERAAEIATIVENWGIPRA